MQSLFNRFLFAGLLIASFPIIGFASPAQSKLLPLIPPEAQIVAGIEDPGNHDTRGHLLLVPVNNRFDFDDFLALTGVDTNRGVDETIWIAAARPQGEIDEHMLLVAGRFDRGHIFRAARQNGAATSFYRGLEVLLVKPFAREERQMHDTRWVAILDGRTVVLGTTWLVQKTLDRYVDHEPVDPLVARRLGRLNPLVNAWSVLAFPSGVSLQHAALGQSSAPLIELLGKDILNGADELTLGIRYGPTSRVDFVVRKPDDSEASGTTDSRDEPSQRHMFEAGLFERRTRLENLSVEQNLIRGSIVLPGKQLDACLMFAACGVPITILRPDR
ncbi:MAG: hypothetical protein WAL75_06955 [Terracidiphilus sp.]